MLTCFVLFDEEIKYGPEHMHLIYFFDACIWILRDIEFAKSSVDLCRHSVSITPSSIH